MTLYFRKGSVSSTSSLNVTLWAFFHILKNLWKFCLVVLQLSILWAISAIFYCWVMSFQYFTLLANTAINIFVNKLSSILLNISVLSFLAVGYWTKGYFEDSRCMQLICVPKKKCINWNPYEIMYEIASFKATLKIALQKEKRNVPNLMIKTMSVSFFFNLYFWLLKSECFCIFTLKTSEVLLSYALVFGCASGIHCSLMFSLWFLTWIYFVALL